MNRHAYTFDRSSALGTVEKLTKDYDTIEKFLENCFVPTIYKYYNQKYFTYFNQALNLIRNEYDDLMYESVAFGEEEEDMEEGGFRGRLKAVKQKNDSIKKRYEAIF